MSKPKRDRVQKAEMVLRMPVPKPSLPPDESPTVGGGSPALPEPLLVNPVNGNKLDGLESQSISPYDASFRWCNWVEGVSALQVKLTLETGEAPSEPAEIEKWEQQIALLDRCAVFVDGVAQIARFVKAFDLVFQQDGGERHVGEKVGVALKISKGAVYKWLKWIGLKPEDFQSMPVKHGAESSSQRLRRLILKSERLKPVHEQLFQLCRERGIF